MKPPQLFAVTDRREEIPDTVTLLIEPLTAHSLPAFSPGQFNMLYSFGAGEVPISFSGLPACEPYYSHTLRAVGKTTRALARLNIGDQLGVRGPFGRGWPLAELRGKHVLVVAGGLGLAPLQPVIETLAAEPDCYASVSLFYGGKRPEELLYPQRIAHWRTAFDVQLSVDAAGPEWHGHIGVVTRLLERATIQVSNSIALVCGPEIMMRFCVQALQQKGLPESSIYLSMERNMHCAVGHCGHCQWGPNFVCRDGPVFRYDEISHWFYLREL